MPDAGTLGYGFAHFPVLWDAEGCLRDPKNPTIGPVELNVPGTGNVVIQRYVYDRVPVVRETYRYVNRDGQVRFTREFRNSGDTILNS